MIQNHNLKQLLGGGKLETYKEKVKYHQIVDLDQLNEKEFDLCLKEVLVTRSLGCKNLAQFHEIALRDMTLCSRFGSSSFANGTCRDVIEGNYKLSESVLYFVLDGILNALHYLHSHQIIHRAIQGDNIMLGNPVLLKGLQYSAHLNNHSKCHTLPPGLETRLPWSSPEMIRQDRGGYNHKTDLYSVGITILELLAGYAPFEGFPNTKIYLMKLSSQTMLPFSRGSGPSSISKRLVRVIDKCVQYEPEDRYDAHSLLKSSFFSKMKSKSSDFNLELFDKYTQNRKSDEKLNNHSNHMLDKSDINNLSCDWLF